MLAFRDDLSCGPIEPDSSSIRAAWWSQFYDDIDVYLAGNPFWERIGATEDRLVVWFGRHSALELAFFLSWTDRLGERPYWIIDVSSRHRVASITPSRSLQLLLGSEEAVTTELRDQCRHDWQRLRAENAPFRVVAGRELVSAPIDHFDPILLSYATSEWQRITYVVGSAMGYDLVNYFQVGDLMLLTRVVALVESGRLIADGDPWDMRGTHIRLPAIASGQGL